MLHQESLMSYHRNKAPTTNTPATNPAFLPSNLPAPAISFPPGTTGSCHPQCVKVPIVTQLQYVVTCHFSCNPNSTSSRLGGLVISGSWVAGVGAVEVRRDMDGMVGEKA